jgi:hypothetical protein
MPRSIRGSEPQMHVFSFLYQLMEVHEMHYKITQMLVIETELII